MRYRKIGLGFWMTQFTFCSELCLIFSYKMSRYRSEEVNETIVVQARMGNKMMLQFFKKLKLKANLFWQILHSILKSKCLHFTIFSIEREQISICLKSISKITENWELLYVVILKNMVRNGFTETTFLSKFS